MGSPMGLALLVHLLVELTLGPSVVQLRDAEANCQYDDVEGDVLDGVVSDPTKLGFLGLVVKIEHGVLLGVGSHYMSCFFREHPPGFFQEAKKRCHVFGTTPLFRLTLRQNCGFFGVMICDKAFDVITFTCSCLMISPIPMRLAATVTNVL